MRRIFFGLALGLLAGACRGTTTPTPPPPIEAAPKVTCPAAQSVQLTSGSSIAITYPAPTTVGGRAPIAIACTPPSGSPLGVGQATVLCTATDGLQRADTCSFTVTVLPVPRLTTTTFLAFGDSITWGEDGRNSATIVPGGIAPRVQLPTAQTYPAALLAALVARYTAQTTTLLVDNRGKPGEAISNPSSSDGPNAVTRLRSLLPGHGAVLIMEGTNDLQKAHSASSAAEAEDILGRAAAGLRQMVRDAKAANVRPLLATVPPINPTGTRGQLYGWELVPGFNERIATIAALEQVPLVNVHKAFAGNGGLLGFDGVHPTAEAYKLIADTFFTAIKSNLETAATFGSGLAKREPSACRSFCP